MSEYKFPQRHSQPGSAKRNSKPIAETLCPVLIDWFETLVQESINILEIGSGEGEQLAAIGEEIQKLHQKNSLRKSISIQPTEVDVQGCQDVNERCKGFNNNEVKLTIHPCHILDIDQDTDWNMLRTTTFDVILLINIVHIVPFSTVQNAFKQFKGDQSSLLHPINSKIVLYGAFDEERKTRSEGNEKFDIYLKQKDERFGLRNIQTDLQPLAKQNGFLLEHKIEMPNGNLLLIFHRGNPESSDPVGSL